MAQSTLLRLYRVDHETNNNIPLAGLVLSAVSLQDTYMAELRFDLQTTGSTDRRAADCAIEPGPAKQKVVTFTHNLNFLKLHVCHKLSRQYKPEQRVIIYAISKGLGKSAHTRSLTRVFAVRRRVVGTLKNLHAKTACL